MTIETIITQSMPCRDNDLCKAKVIYALHGTRHVIRASFGGYSVQRSRSVPFAWFDLMRLVDRLDAKIRGRK